MQSKKRLLLISYYWAPAGGAGVQRWLKMVKHLSKTFDISVFCPSNANYPFIDETLKNEVPQNVKLIQNKIIEPYALAQLFSKKNKSIQKGNIPKKESQSKLTQLSLWVRANWFVPDARMLWIKPSIRFLSSQISQFDYMVTTGPPHSTHLIGLGLKKLNKEIVWLADFRDPWTQIDYFKNLPFTSKALKKHKSLEKEVLQKANIVTTVSPSWKNDLQHIGGRKVEVVYNGFDEEDFENLIRSMNKGFQLTYIGSLNSDRNVPNLWIELNQILSKNEYFASKFTLNFAGNIDDSVKTQIDKLPYLKNRTNYLGYVNHTEALQLIQYASVLLLLINDTPNQKGIIPGKFFEYLATENKILAIGERRTDIEDLINKTKCGQLFPRTDLRNLEPFLLNLKNEVILMNKDTSEIKKYTRKAAAQKIEKLLIQSK